MLVLTHLQPDLNVFGIKENMLREMADIYTGPIIVGEDLMEIPLKIIGLGAAD